MPDFASSTPLEVPKAEEKVWVKLYCITFDRFVARKLPRDYVKGAGYVEISEEEASRLNEMEMIRNA